MLNRLIRTFGKVFGEAQAKPVPMPQSAEILPPASQSQLIMKDVYTNAEGSKTAIELRSNALTLESDSGESHTIPLDSINALEQVDDDVRAQIARKISLLLPALAESKKDQLLHHVFHVLMLLAEDQLPRVRRMIAEELRDSYAAPPELIRKLAWDEELEVAAPVLEFSPLLGDADLLEIISHSDIPGVMEAISRRREVSGDVTDAIIRNITHSKISKEDARIISALLANKGAKFREDTLEIIVDEAPRYEIWHSALIDRPELTTRTINKIARFVSKALIMEMEGRGMITSELGHNLTQAIASRLHNPHIDREKEADRQVIDLFTQGTLDGHYVMAALDNGEREFVISALSLLADIPKSVTKKLVESDDPKAVTALSWKAGIPMREAIQLQLKLAKIHYTRILYAREGMDYPLDEPTMQKLLRRYMRSAA